MSEIRDIPDVKDASGIFKFDAGKKAIIVPISAVERLVRSLPKSPNEDIVMAWRDEMRKDPLIVQAAKAETTPMDWSDLEFDPDLIKNKLL